MNAKRITFWCVLVALAMALACASSCGATPGHVRDARDVAPVAETKVTPATAHVAPSPRLRIATFNIQVFGASKSRKPAVMDTLATIIRRYDLVAVQEIKDASGTVAQRFLDLINRGGPTYALALSPRTGREPDDREAQEQYAYFYRTDRVRVVGDATLFDDSAHDYFQREPFLSRFQLVAGGGHFVLINIHTQPRQAVSEIAAMEHVFLWAKSHFTDEQNFIALGDFNAGCGYASEEDLNALPLHGQAYNWVVPHSADTNVAPTSCPYDRIVIASPKGTNFVDHWGVDKAFTDKVVSDHWPVWVELVF